MKQKDYKLAMAYLQNLKKESEEEGTLQEPVVVGGLIMHLENIFYLISTTDTTTESTKGFLTAKEYGKQYGIHPYTAKRLAAEGKIKATKIGGQWRFNKEKTNDK